MKDQLVTHTDRIYSGTNPCEWITVHETGNRSPGANAQAHANLQSNGGARQASWHVQVDDTEAIRSYPDTAQCWHGGTSEANLNSLALEICVNEGGDYEAAFRRAARVVRDWRIKHKLGRDRVVQHHHWTGKNCPTQMRTSARWKEFLDLTEPIQTIIDKDVTPGMISPCKGRVTSEFSTSRRHPVTGIIMAHWGIDIAAPVGTPIVAAYDGTVIGVRTNSFVGDKTLTHNRSGCYVFIQNPDGEKQWYGHVSKVHVKVGQKVKKGDHIADVGATGNVTGAHLHFETHNKGSNVRNGYSDVRNPRIDFSHHKVTPGSEPTINIIPVGNVTPIKKDPAPAKGKTNTRADNEAIQQALAGMDLYHGLIDGVDGPLMKAAVKAFQRRHGLHPDGYWGPVTQAKYVALGRPGTAPTKKYRSLRRGSTGNDVLAVARALRSRGYTKQGDTRTYTAQLEANVKDYQRRTGLVQDGVAGEITQKRLGL